MLRLLTLCADGSYLILISQAISTYSHTQSPQCGKFVRHARARLAMPGAASFRKVYIFLEISFISVLSASGIIRMPLWVQKPINC
jgi:hypothetical protein